MEEWKNIIYLRVKTEEQNPFNQLEACQKLATKLNINDYEVLQDKVSGWKELERASFNQLNEGIKKQCVESIIVWDLDRLFRNRKKLIAFLITAK